MLDTNKTQPERTGTADQLISQSLLSISNDIASARTKDDLIEVLLQRMKTLVPFDDILLTLYNEQKKAHYIWAHRYYDERREHFQFDFYIMSEFPENDNVLDVIQRHDGPVVFDIAAMVESGKAPGYMQYYHENGLASFVGVAMRSKAGIVGGFFLTSKTKGNFKSEHLSLLKGISSQLCIASSNVIANEAVTKHEKEKTILLSLSNSIANIRSKHELCLKVVENLKKLETIDDVMVSFYEPSKNAHFFFDYTDSALSGPGALLINADEVFTKEINNQIIYSRKPLTFDVAELINSGKASESVSQYHDLGIRDLSAIAMRNGDNFLGCIYIASKSDSRFNGGDVGLLQGIADQLCFALINIEANDEIMEKELEKSILLSISNDIAAIRNKNELLEMVQQRLKSLMYFSHAVTAVVNTENQTYTSFIVDPNSKSKDYPGFERIVYTSHSVKHPMIRTVLSSKEPVVLDLDELILTHEMPEWAVMNHHSGIKEMVVAPLYTGNELIGFFIMLTDRKKQISAKEIRLIQGVSWQLSVAVANLIANEHVMESNNEKATLLQLSQHFAVIRNREDLHHIINQKLKQLLPISHVITLKITDDRKRYAAYSLDPESVAIHHHDYKSISSSEYDINDGILDKVLSAANPMVFDLDELNKSGTMPPYLRMNYECGIKEAILSSLKDGDRKTGIMVILMKQKNDLDQNYINMIQGVSDQLSTALANISANEQIQLQLDEIDRYKRQLEEENLYLQEEIHTNYNYSELIGNSQAMKQIFQLVSKVAESESSVLILGETGTGKELIARAIHSTSLRKDKVMIKVNCATLPANLIESELFGNERGSFTGATEKRIGKFELANNSTLFLDEVGELPLDLQVKLLRVLQEKEIERVGGRSTIKTNVRIIAATNRDLQKEVQDGNFRSDLFFRLNVFPISIPPLRERKEDIPLLSSHFLIKHALKGMKGGMSFSARAVRELTGYDWPGNVRELEHLIERSILLSNGKVVDHVHLPVTGSADGGIINDGYIKTIDEIEREYIVSILKKCNGKVSGAGGAAELLKIPATTLSSKILRLKIGKGLGKSTQ